MSKLNYKVTRGGHFEVDPDDVKNALRAVLEMHADGVKEVREECPFCEVPCMNEWCEYTPKEQ